MPSLYRAEKRKVGKKNRVTYPVRGWIHEAYKNPHNRALFTNNSNPYKDRASFKHIMHNSVIDNVPNDIDASDRIEDFIYRRHIGFRNANAPLF